MISTSLSVLLWFVMFILYRNGLSFKHRRHTFFATHGDAPGRADTQAGWPFPGFQPFKAKVALDRDFQFFFELHGPERACFNAFPATDAQVVVNENDSAFIPGNGVHRAGVPAGRLGALVAVNRNEIRTFFCNVYQPGADFQVVFLFAGHFASMAPHAVIFFDNQGVLSHSAPPIGLHSG
jgi:hypothetical protein